MNCRKKNRQWWRSRNQGIGINTLLIQKSPDELRWGEVSSGDSLFLFLYLAKVPLHRPCGTSRVTHQLPPYPDVLCELVYQYCRRQSPILMTGDTCDTCFLKLSLTRAGRKNFPERFPARLRERDFKKSLSLVSSCHPKVSLIPAS